MAKRKKKKDTRSLWFSLAIVAAVCLAVISLLRPGVTRTAEPNAATDAPEETVAESTWDTEAFYTEDGFLRYRDAAHLVGIDVSAHQGVIDWAAVKAAGVEFAVLRIGYRGSTVGELYEDAQFRENLLGARSVGLRVGAYFFSQALNAEEAAEEAAFACAVLDGETLDLPLYFDWEVTAASERVQSEADVDLTACATAFCEAAEANGCRGGVYFNQTQGYLYYDLSELADYSLWLAEYGDAPTFPHAYQCLQYSDAGQVDGIEVSVDLNILFVGEASSHDEKSAN